MRALGPPLASLCAIVSGCTLLEPLDNLEGDGAAGAADAPTATDGHTVTDAAGGSDGPAAPDAPVDASVHEASPGEGGDALRETSNPVDAPVAPDGSVHYCASLSPPPTLCADFDEGTAFDAEFTDKFVASTGHLGSDGAYDKSAPDSLFSSTDPSTPSVDAFAFLSRTFTGTGSRIELAFDVLVLQTVSGQHAVTAALLVDDSQPTQHQLALVLGDSNEVEESFTAADGGGIFNDTLLAVSPSVGSWSHVDMVLSLPQRTVSVTVDGTAALTAAPLDPSWPASGALAVDVGIAYVSGTSGPWSIRYDNVVANPQ
jgi:hypothetical protein